MWRQAQYLEMKENSVLSLEKYPFTRRSDEEKKGSRSLDQIARTFSLFVCAPPPWWHHLTSSFPFSKAAFLNSSPCAPLWIFCISLFVNTPDSDNQLIRSALRAWTVLRLTCSLHGVHCSLLPEQGKSVEVYFTSEHSFMDLHCATSSRTDKSNIIHLCKYIQFKFSSRTLQCSF